MLTLLLLSVSALPSYPSPNYTSEDLQQNYRTQYESAFDETTHQSHYCVPQHEHEHESIYLNQADETPSNDDNPRGYNGIYDAQHQYNENGDTQERYQATETTDQHYCNNGEHQVLEQLPPCTNDICLYGYECQTCEWTVYDAVEVIEQQAEDQAIDEQNAGRNGPYVAEYSDQQEYQARGTYDR